MKRNGNLDQLIELFFFDPTRSRDDYIEFYKNICSDRFTREKGYRYSLLFLVLKDIRYCFGIGKEFNPVRDELNPANFAGVILLDLAFRNLVKRVFSGDFSVFARDYMGIKQSSDLGALRILRNALEHSFYSLYYYENSKKIYFSLGYYPEIIKKDKMWKRPYPSEMYLVNPWKLYTAFIKGLRKFKDDLLNYKNAKMRSRFKKNTDIDNWVFIRERIEKGGE